jgi:hypothetical protein
MPFMIHIQLIFGIWHKIQKCQGTLLLLLLLLLYLPRGAEENFVNCYEIADTRVCRNLLTSVPSRSFQTDMT